MGHPTILYSFYRDILYSLKFWIASRSKAARRLQKAPVTLELSSGLG